MKDEGPLERIFIIYCNVSFQCCPICLLVTSVFPVSIVE